MIYIHKKNTVTFYEAPESIETSIHNLLMCRDDTDVGMGYDGELTRPAYEQGLNDAWECARKLMLTGGLSYSELYQIFECGTEHDILRKESPAYVIAKIKEYEEKQKEVDRVTSQSIIKSHLEDMLDNFTLDEIEEVLKQMKGE